MTDLHTCCEAWARAKQRTSEIVRATLALGANTPRHAVLLWQSLGDVDRSAFALVAMHPGRCPCHDVPHPRALREFARVARDTGDINAAIDAAVPLLDDEEP